MTDTGSRVATKPPAGTAAVVRRDPDEERRKTKHGLVRDRAPRPAGSSFGGGLPSFSLAVGRDAIALPAHEDRDPETAAELEPQPDLMFAPIAAPAPAPVPAPIAPLAAPSGLLDLSEPGDRLEREADEAAERVVRRLAVAPAAPPATPPHPAPSPRAPPAYARSLLVQRASLVEVVAESAGLVPRLDSLGGLIVDDRTETLTPGQMKKTPFLAQLREVVTETAERELRRAGRSAQDCPYLEEILGRFARRSPDQLERAIRRYAPEARAATRARDYLPPLATRLGQGIATWVGTGRTPDNLPDEFRPGRLSSFLEVGASLGRAARALFKGKDGTPGRPGVDPAALAGQLGPGRPLDGSARARMESAFGHPFGDVRLHVDDRAAALSRELEARAFTLGSHVAFGAGEFRPGTPVGDALLAHELAHVVQQSGARPLPEPPIDTAAPAHELDADEAAASDAPSAHNLAHVVPRSGASAGPLAQDHAPSRNAVEEDADRATAGVVASLYAHERAPRDRRPRLRSGLRLSRCGAASTLTPLAQTPRNPGPPPPWRNRASMESQMSAAVALLWASPVDVDYNTARTILAGRPQLYQTNELRHERDIVSQADRCFLPDVSPDRVVRCSPAGHGLAETFRDENGENPVIVFDSNHLAASPEAAQMMGESYLREIASTLVHEVNHAVNREYRQSDDPVWGNFESEFSARWVEPRFRRYASDAEKAQAIRIDILGNLDERREPGANEPYRSIRLAYRTNPRFRERVNNYNSPINRNLSNVFPAAPGGAASSPPG